MSSHPPCLGRRAPTTRCTSGFVPEDELDQTQHSCHGFRPPARSAAPAICLTDQRGLIYRYLANNGLTGKERTFLLCTFWLAQAQALAGDVDKAAATFERAVAAINDVSLLAEEVDVPSGEMIGNFPQAFSHIGLINAVWAITQAQRRATRPPPPARAGPGGSAGTSR